MIQCPECGEAATEPKLRYCEHCGARMPEYKLPALVPEEGAGLAGGAAAARPAKPPYTGPKWLEHVPAHSPTVLGVGLLLVALGLSILPALAGVGPFWSFVMLMGSLLVVAREFRAAGERHPLVEWIPESLHPPLLPAVYTALAVGLSLPMLELSVQPLLWLGGTALLVHDQRGKVFTGPGGYAELFDPRALVRGQRVLALAGASVCLLALLFTWTADREITGGVSGLALPVGPTVELGLLALLVLLMLKPEVDRPVWLRFVPVGFTVIALAWGLVNRSMEVGPIMFLAGLIPVGLIAVLQALGRDEPAPDQAEEDPLPEDELSDTAMGDDFPTEPEAEPLPKEGKEELRD